MRRADLILHAGDISTARDLKELRGYAPVCAVIGNNDEAQLARALPAETVVEVEETRIGLVHDAGRRAGREARLRSKFPDCGAVVYGHSHVPQVELHDGVWILNPGSPTERRRAPARSMIVLGLRGKKLSPRLVTLT